MSVFLSNLPAIAIGHNNAAQMMHLHWYNNKLFRRYYEYIETRYKPYETLVLSAARRQKPLGLPSAEWVFPYLDVDQVKYIMNTFFPNNQRDRAFTIRTLDTEVNVWYNYNAIGELPNFAETWDGTAYKDVVWKFFDLRRI